VKIRPYTLANFDVVTLLWRHAREIAFPEFQRIKGYTFEEGRAYFQNVILQETDVYIADMDSIAAVTFLTIIPKTF